MIKGYKLILERIIKTYGNTSQSIQAIEEFSELTVEVTKNINRGKIETDDLLSEIADAQIMLDQLKIIHGFSDGQVENKMFKKLERQVERMNKNEI